jgi:polar amino acid transport system permease protein
MSEHELLFLLSGLKWTLILSGFGFAGGGIVGMLVALARSARGPLLAGAARGYIALFQGTPLLMQLFVVYYGVALLGIEVDASTAVLLALSLHASAFLGEIWRGSIAAIPAGQTEAADALGLHYLPRMRHVILPQALRIALPATVGFLVQLVKGTSLAAIIGFIELTRAGQIISNQIYRPLLVFGVVGAVYFAICWPLSLLGGRLEGRLARATR